jgi:TIR domain
VRAFEREGWSVWWDPSLQTGSHVPNAITAALREAKLVVVVWSKESIGRDWVLGESDDARVRGVLIPVRIDPVEPPLQFRQLHTSDLSAWRGETGHGDLKQVLLTLRTRLGPGDPPNQGRRVAGQRPPAPAQPAAPPQPSSGQAGKAPAVATKGGGWVAAILSGVAFGTFSIARAIWCGNNPSGGDPIVVPSASSVAPCTSVGRPVRGCGCWGPAASGAAVADGRCCSGKAVQLDCGAKCPSGESVWQAVCQ